MARRTLNKLSPSFVAKTKEPGRHSDGGGLYLAIDVDGRRRWIFMFTRHGKRSELGLGGGRDLPLADARALASEMRTAIERGGDPRAVRAKAKEGQTFGEFADAYVETMRPSWRNAKHAAQWTMTLTKYAAKLRPLMLDTIGTEDVLTVLKPLWQRTPETAERLRGRIECVLDAAKAKDLRSGENPARWRGHLDKMLPKRQRLRRGHHAALSYDQLPAFMARLSVRPALAARMLEFTILTAVRSGEAIGAKWAEVDFDKALWTIPADRMKAGKEHRVPLSPAAVAILQAIQADQAKLFDKPRALVFASATLDKPLSNMAMGMLLRRMEVQEAGRLVTVHGFRSSFRDWAAEATGFPHEVCEMALAHTIANKAEAAYRRGDLFEKRRKLMEAWAAYCLSPVGVAGATPIRVLAI